VTIKKEHYPITQKPLFMSMTIYIIAPKIISTILSTIPENLHTYSRIPMNERLRYYRGKYPIAILFLDKKKSFYGYFFLPGHLYVIILTP
jgi:hypothetical protein